MSPIKEFEEGEESFQGDKAGARRNRLCIREFAESHVAALQKQAADLLLEYDRLLEDNQNHQTQDMGYR